MKPSVYIETSIPSFYCEVRTEPDMVARREWTREWWDNHIAGYVAYTSEAVIEELEGGSFPGKEDALKLIDSLPLLDINEPIADIVATYISHHVMPSDPAGDALHLSIASFNRVVPQMRFSGNMELPPLGQREQVWPHPSDQYVTRSICNFSISPGNKV